MTGRIHDLVRAIRRRAFGTRRWLAVVSVVSVLVGLCASVPVLVGQSPMADGCSRPVRRRRSRTRWRADSSDALNHTQFTGVNATANFASLTDRTITNLPYDASGALVRPNGFGAINGVSAPRTLQLVTRFTF